MEYHNLSLELAKAAHLIKIPFQSSPFPRPTTQPSLKPNDCFLNMHDITGRTCRNPKSSTKLSCG